MKIKELVITNTYPVPSNAFALCFLQLRNLHSNIDGLWKEAFAGLNSINTLMMIDHYFVNFSVIEYGVFELISDSLKSFTLIEKSESIGIFIENIIGDNSETTECRIRENSI